MNAVFEQYRVTRRQFLVAGAGVAGSLVIGLPALANEIEEERTIGWFVQINPDGTVPGGISLADLIASKVGEVGEACEMLTLEVTPGFEDWIQNLSPPSYEDLVLPATVIFTLDICVPLGTPPGEYVFEICAVCDGEVRVCEADTITVPEEVAQVNVPVAFLIWLMIIPMLLKVDFTALHQVKSHWKGIGVTLFINWAVKPFSMALLGWLFIRVAFSPYLPADQLDAYIAGLIILAAAPCTATGE